MFEVADIRGVASGARDALGPTRARIVAQWRAGFAAAFQTEIDERRLFLWAPVLAGAGVVIYFAADREPSAIYSSLLFVVLAAAAFFARARPAAVRMLVAAAAIVGGVASGALRTARRFAQYDIIVTVVDITVCISSGPVTRPPPPLRRIRHNSIGSLFSFSNLIEEKEKERGEKNHLDDVWKYKRITSVCDYYDGAR